MTRQELERQLTLTYALSDRLSSRSLLGYLSRVVIDARPEPRPFWELADPWQRELALSKVPALESVAGLRTDYAGPRAFWDTLGRGHDKTSSIGRLLNWLLAYSRRRLSMVVAAADSEQAELIVEAMKAEAALNPWLDQRVRHGRKRVYGPGGLLKVLAADTSGNWGHNADVIVLDEITHWDKEDLWGVLWSGREKRPGSVFVVISNAGVIGSWQEDLLHKAKADPVTWRVWEAPPGRQLASWMGPEAVARMRAMLPRGLAKRVLDNIWIDPAEEADFLTRAEIEACLELGREMRLARASRGQKGIRYVAGIDYGPRRDRTALVVLHLDSATGVVVVDRLDVWQGSPDDPIRVQAVEDWIREVNRDFHRPDLVIDPYQMEGTAQEFEGSQEVERFEARGGKRTYEMAENLRSLIVSKRLAWYPGAGDVVLPDGRIETLVDEIAGLVIKPTPYGYRFDHQAGFHDDRTVAIGMAALHALRMDPSGPGVAAVPLAKPEKKEGPRLYTLGRQKGEGFSRRGIWGT